MKKKINFPHQFDNSGKAYRLFLSTEMELYTSGEGFQLHIHVYHAAWKANDRDDENVFPL